MSEDQCKYIRELEIKIDEKSDELRSLKSIYEKQLRMLQDVCPHPVFNAEHNGDCHSSGYYYVCETCKYFQTTKPTNSKTVYK